MRYQWRTAPLSFCLRVAPRISGCAPSAPVVTDQAGRGSLQSVVLKLFQRKTFNSSCGMGGLSDSGRIAPSAANGALLKASSHSPARCVHSTESITRNTSPPQVRPYPCSGLEIMGLKTAPASDTRSPRPLEVIPTQPASDVYCFSDEVQTRNVAGLHTALV